MPDLAAAYRPVVDPGVSFVGPGQLQSYGVPKQLLQSGHSLIPEKHFTSWSSEVIFQRSGILCHRSQTIGQLDGGLEAPHRS